MSRSTMRDLRREILWELLDEGWLTPSELCDRLGTGHGVSWYRVALVLERLAHEGLVELRNPASRGKRYFRRRQR